MGTAYNAFSVNLLAAVNTEVPSQFTACKPQLLLSATCAEAWNQLGTAQKPAAHLGPHQVQLPLTPARKPEL